MSVSEAVLSGLRGSKALVTGGLGFIGSNLARRLVCAGVRVTVVDCSLEGSGSNHFNISGLEHSIELEQEELASYCSRPNVLNGVSSVFHLAAATSHVGSMRYPMADLAANQQSSLALFEAIRAQEPNAKVVFTSTRQVYGTPLRLPVNESHPVAPPDVNAIHKLAIEAYLQLYSRAYGIRSATLRLTNTYGPGMRIRDAKQMFLGIWIRRLLESQPFEVFGSGNQLRDLSYVDDVVDALILALNVASDGSCYNIGGLSPVSLLELARMLISANGGGAFEKVEFPLERKSIDVGNFVGSYEKFSAATGWQPRTSLHVGLLGVLGYYRKCMERYIS
jgi:UDP-glucose 4-epimerase